MAYSSKVAGAKAYGRRIDMSPKHAMEICSYIRGMNAEKADKFLSNVQAKEEYVPLKRFNRKVPHRTGGQPGRYPVKAAKIIQKLLRNAMSNAEQKGMDREKLKIVHAASHRGPSYGRRKPKGRWKHHSIDTTHVEIIVNA
ncbi:MAG: 50S ribosomal protein L22 [Candidatus Diapherotrites archaeon]|nr:50S ribosomal protein L22 [Candidatus Diapherotrites archaeon]